jgi:hypothetical protein
MALELMYVRAEAEREEKKVRRAKLKKIFLKN